MSLGNVWSMERWRNDVYGSCQGMTAICLELGVFGDFVSGERTAGESDLDASCEIFLIREDAESLEVWGEAAKIKLFR